MHQPLAKVLHISMDNSIDNVSKLHTLLHRLDISMDTKVVLVYIGISSLSVIRSI